MDSPGVKDRCQEPGASLLGRSYDDRAETARPQGATLIVPVDGVMQATRESADTVSVDAGGSVCGFGCGWVGLRGRLRVERPETPRGSGGRSPHTRRRLARHTGRAGTAVIYFCGGTVAATLPGLRLPDVAVAVVESCVWVSAGADLFWSRPLLNSHLRRQVRRRKAPCIGANMASFAGGIPPIRQKIMDDFFDIHIAGGTRCLLKGGGSIEEAGTTGEDGACRRRRPAGR